MLNFKFNKKLIILFITILILGTILFPLMVLTASTTNLIFNYNKMEYNCQSMSSDWDSNFATQTIDTYSSIFRPLKEFENIYSWGPIYLLENNVYFVGALSKTDEVQLLNLNVESGLLNWHLCETEAFFVEQDRVYVGHTDFAGAFIIAFDTETGEKIWQTKVDHRAINNIQRISDGLLLTTNDHGDKRYYLIDVETGEEKRSFQDYYTKNEYFVSSGQTIYQQTPRGLSAQGNVNWEIEFANLSGRQKISTTLVGNILLIEVDTNSIIQIYAINHLNGDLLWQTDWNVKSNLVVEDNVVYFLTGDSILKAVDLLTGNDFGKIQFSPSLNSLSEFDYINSHPQISIDNQILVIYFDTSRQLFTFRILE